MNRLFVVSIVVVGSALSGCSKSDDGSDSDAAADSPRSAELKSDISGDQNVSVTPLLKVPSIEGWHQGAAKTFSNTDLGFSIDLDHESGMHVTYYEYTGGVSDIPNFLDSPALNAEFQMAKTEFDVAIERGIWESAELELEGVERLGASKKHALQAKFLVKVDGESLTSSILLFSYANTFIKLRCTERPNRDRQAQEKALAQLLTRIGDACLEGNFTGRWVLNVERCELGLDDLRKELSAGVLAIDHREPKFSFQREFIIGGAPTRVGYNLEIDGPINEEVQEDRTLRMSLRRENDDLLFHTEILSDNAIATNDVTYTVLDNGDTLQAKEVYRSESLNYENLWVFTRE